MLRGLKHLTEGGGIPLTQWNFLSVVSGLHVGSWATPWSLSPLPHLRGLQAVILCLIQLLPDSNTCALYSKLHEPHFPSVTGAPLGPWKSKGVKQKCSTTLNTSHLGFRFSPLSRPASVAPNLGFYSAGDWAPSLTSPCWQVRGQRSGEALGVSPHTPLQKASWCQGPPVPGSDKSHKDGASQGDAMLFVKCLLKPKRT